MVIFNTFKYAFNKHDTAADGGGNRGDMRPMSMMAAVMSDKSQKISIIHEWANSNFNNFMISTKLNKQSEAKFWQLSLPVSCDEHSKMLAQLKLRLCVYMCL